MLTLMLMRLLRIIMLTVIAARVALGEMEKPTHKHAKTSARRAAHTTSIRGMSQQLAESN
jgi:hypothetical protein